MSTIAVLLIGLTLTLTTCRAEENDTLYVQVWRQISTVIKPALDRFEEKCTRLDTPFSATKVYTELESCIRPHVKGLLTLVQMKDNQTNEISLILHEIMGRTEREERMHIIQPFQIDLLRKRLAEPICEFIQNFLNCTHARQVELIQNCDHARLAERETTDYVNTLLQSLCKENGTRVLDFIQTGGLYCAPNYLTTGFQCIHKYSSGYGHPKSTEVCARIKKFHDCLTTGANSVCLVEKPVKILGTVLDEVQPWISGPCIASNSDTYKRSLPKLVFVFLVATMNLMLFTHN